MSALIANHPVIYGFICFTIGAIVYHMIASWFNKKNGGFMIEYHLGYTVTGDGHINMFDTRLAEAIKRTSEQQMAYLLNPSLKPEPDYYIWYDPWEYIDKS